MFGQLAGCQIDYQILAGFCVLNRDNKLFFCDIVVQYNRTLEKVEELRICFGKK